MCAIFRNRSDGWWKLGAILAHGDEFANTSGTLRGTRRPTGTGRLPAPWVKRFRHDRDGHGVGPGIDYVVYSYATPIAWHIPGQGWTVPTETYSVTTTRHQRAVNLAIYHRADAMADAA
ncbi:hypothetical protein FHX69_0175 [Prauserella muralis]|nr:hypothetical protein FHX69_0175 [Prauserella muralis]